MRTSEWWRAQATEAAQKCDAARTKTTCRKWNQRRKDCEASARQHERNNN